MAPVRAHSFSGMILNLPGAIILARLNASAFLVLLFLIRLNASAFLVLLFMLL
jgi:hypothetical protein